MHGAVVDIAPDGGVHVVLVPDRAVREADLAPDDMLAALLSKAANGCSDPIGEREVRGLGGGS